jgi:hypothetical protein
MTPRRTRPSKTTRTEEVRDARVEHGADEGKSADAEQAEPPEVVDDETREHYEEMIERGAHQRGEGKLP